MIYDEQKKRGRSSSRKAGWSIPLVSLLLSLLGILGQSFFDLSRYIVAEGQQAKLKSKQSTILFLVMGEKQYFEKWYTLLDNLNHSKNSSNIVLTLLFGSYDRPILISNEKAYDSNTTHFQTRYIPHTTWTEGRNQLAAEAILMEHYAHKQFDYWIFLDEDVDLISSVQNTTEGSWLMFLDFLMQLPTSDDQHSNKSSAVPITTLAVRALGWIVPPGSYHQWTATYTPDAMLAAMPRQYIPSMLPYVTLPPSHSQWTSQAVWTCVLKHCFDSYPVIFAPHLLINNTAHRPYRRDNFELQWIVQDAKAAYDSYVPDLAQTCWIMKYTQYIDILGPFDTFQDTLDGIERHATTTTIATNVTGHNNKQAICSPLVRRFHDWERTILEQHLATGGAR